MVWFCCCMGADERDHEEDLNSSHRNIGLHGLILALCTKFAALFNKGETPALPEANPSVTLLPSSTITYQAPLQSHSNQAQFPEQVQVEEVLLVQETDDGNRGKSNQRFPEFAVRLSDEKPEAGLCYIYPSLHEEEEEECPTCLEEYTSDNPKIISKCNHHFHLACIYEWMMRSETCPVCSKVMIFEEKN